MTTPQYNIELHQGCTFRRYFRVQDSIADNANPIDITGYTITSGYARSPGGTPVAAFTCTITDAADGRFTVEYDVPNDAATGTFFWDLVLENTDDERVPYAKGRASVYGVIAT